MTSRPVMAPFSARRSARKVLLPSLAAVVPSLPMAAPPAIASRQLVLPHRQVTES
jgi:hypothetical protein